MNFWLEVEDSCGAPRQGKKERKRKHKGKWATCADGWPAAALRTRLAAPSRAYVQDLHCSLIELPVSFLFVFILFLF
jgi:hypothetical protein